MADQYEQLVAHITKEILNDDDQSQRLADVYLSADETGKDVLNRAFICLCGWSLETLMKQVDTEAEHFRR